MKIKDFRSRGRLPALSWRNNNNGSTITRCSQPRVGLLNARCVEDENLLAEIAICNQLSLCNNDDVNAKELYIMDARPKANAMANHAVGAGVEDINRLIFILFLFNFYFFIFKLVYLFILIY